MNGTIFAMETASSLPFLMRHFSIKTDRHEDSTEGGTRSQLTEKALGTNQGATHELRGREGSSMGKIAEGENGRARAE